MDNTVIPTNKNFQIDLNDVLTKVLKKVKSPLQTDDLRVDPSHDHSAAVEDSARTTGNGSADG